MRLVKKFILAVALCCTSLTLAYSSVSTIDKAMLLEGDLEEANHYFYDASHVRYELYQINEGEPYNWLFLPGGPGADSSYLYSLIDELELPGNVWLIDLPGNGSNVQEGFEDNFDQWLMIFPEVVKRFDQPVLVGHSFGGMFPLLFPELEHYLKGFVILNSAPCLWFEEAIAYSQQFDLPDFSQEMYEFTLNPNDETFRVALQACMPYYFPQSNFERGRAFFLGMIMRYQPSVWFVQKTMEWSFSATWIPQQVPTLIVGAKYDCMCPFSLFNNDERFHRPNIDMLFIEDGGHAPWFENPAAVREAFREFVLRLSML